MSLRPITPPSLPKPEEFRPEKFKRKTKVRDYVIYSVALIIVLGVIGGSVYFFTRSKTEQDQLRAKLDEAMKEAGLGEKEPTPLPQLKAPKLDGLLGEEHAEADAKAAAAQTESKAASVSTYSGGGPNRILLSDDAKLPKASVAFMQFVEALRVSSVVQGTPAKIMIAGKLFRAGEVIDEQLGVTFVGVDAAKIALILRDRQGAELRLSY